MKFLPKNMIFINWSEKGSESVWTDYFCYRSNDGHLKIRLSFSKTMVSNYDVINKRLTKGDQKRFSGSHSKPVFKIPILMNFLEFWCNKAVDLCIDFHRTLSEGQENDRRLKTFSGSHLEDNDWNSLLLFSYHLTWSD